MLTQTELNALLKKSKIELSELDKNKVYLIEINVGNIPIEQVSMMCNKLSYTTKEYGLKCIWIPVREGMGNLKIYELNKVTEIEERN